MKNHHLLLPLTIAPLCLAMWGCNGHSHHEPATTTLPADSASQLPVLGEATPASLSMCEDLANQFSFDDTVITSATTVAAGVQPSGDVDFDEPAHCVISGYMNERSGKGVDGDVTYRIGFEMRLPFAWNGRFLYQANGGLDGIVLPALGRFFFTSGLQKGFAVISGDSGHDTIQYGAGFGLDPQARKNYGYNDVAVLTPMAKQLIATAYGKAPDRSYFAGCSNGGRHTMVAANRFADMYDGYLVGNPGFHLPKAAIDQMYGIQQYSTLVNVDQNDILGSLQQAVTQQEFALISRKVLQQCDALDGAADGMINALEQCQEVFNLDRDVPTCTGERDGTCLTQAQKTVINNIMGGAHNSLGEALYTNFPYDGGMGTDDYFQWEYFTALMRDPAAVGYVFSTPAADFDFNSDVALYHYIEHYDLDKDVQKIYATNNEFTESGWSVMVPPDETDYSAIRDRGAKMMVVHGTSDAVFSVQDTINWYNALQDANSKDAETFARLYLVPNMNHCGFGPSTDNFDMLDKLVDWVEDGTAPEAINASVRANNAELPADWSKQRTRPLCPYPQQATYNGSGSVEDAASFSCKAPE